MDFKLVGELMSNFDPPPAHARSARAIQEIEAATIIAGLTHDCHRVLNVGPSWGRDYYALTRAGHDVFNLDVARQIHLPNITICDITYAAPFPDRSFDAVLMAEVLEHIWDDRAALYQARRILKDAGKLIITVPFYHDLPEYHVRIHSPATIRRLLQAGGFRIVDYIERGGAVAFARVVNGLRRIARLAGRDDAFTQLVVRFDIWLGRRPGLLRRSGAFGCYIAAVKSEAVDFEQLNRVEFAHEQ
jgi:SAM-dependent methyltransferase